MSLKGKKAVVTGASRGIGAAIAKKLALEGADVVITYEKNVAKANEVVEAIRTSGRAALAIQADSAQTAAVKRSIETAHEFLGGIDILVNNAGVIRVESLEKMSQEDIDAMVKVNIQAPIAATQAVIPYLGQGARIVNIGSFFANNVDWPNLTVYSMTKSAQISFTKGLARELGARGITANLVQPGAIDTDMNPAEGDFSSITKPMIPGGEYGRGDDIANAVAFLASEEASYINGASLTVDGGLTA
ncbi:3-oxoacyl-ACP reductase family protein [Paraburkholderia sp. ZP32-5]|uniref:3-oxoacyl-ACP reductase family protein n=1 Tax=Paraburkholderia sp. ZP32-5 TaxID=2883245 RepID=UPI001F38F3C3|nr:3-oxoacyl-ACP reductase family protein [Paraburkholderia sp. ZP32-5]